MKIRGIVATTHVDRHGDRITKEALEQAAEQSNRSNRPLWSYWNHQTTLPPIGVITKQEVEKGEDGEYQLVAEMDLLGDEDREILPRSDIKGLDVTSAKLAEATRDVEPSSGYLEISYDPRNFDPQDVEPIIESLNALVETRKQLRVRKAELPQAVVWILVAFATGFVARLGELSAEKVVELHSQLAKRLAELIQKTKTRDTVDVIFSIPFSDTDMMVEGAIENVDTNTLEGVWSRLPSLYTTANQILQRNPKDFFAEMKFLYNPQSKEWEINYLTIRKTHRVILGPRYYDPKHPLRQRWDEEIEKLKRMQSHPNQG